MVRAITVVTFSEPVLDIAALSVFLPEINDAPHEAEKEITFFVTHARKHQLNILQAIDAQDWDALNAQVHRLGSSAAMFGLSRLSSACRTIERLISKAQLRTLPAQAADLPALIEQGVSALKQIVSEKTEKGA